MSKKRKTEDTVTRERYADEKSVEIPAACRKCGSTNKSATHNHRTIARDINGTERNTGMVYNKVKHIRTKCENCGQYYEYIRYENVRSAE